MNVLSLFDGMSCGQLALDKAGIKYNNYYAYELDKFAIQVARANYPKMVHLGDVNDWCLHNLPQIDLLIGGSPCQGFSFAGKQLNFDDPRSKLFFVYVDILKAYKPKYFLLENVKMKREYQDVISNALGVEPIEINSSLVSAKNRKRLYWTNIHNITQPEDKGILLKDILEDGVVDREKGHCLDANYFKGGNLKSYFEKHRRQLVFSNDNLCHIGDADLKGNESIKRVYHPDGKGPYLTTMGGGHREPKILLKPRGNNKGGLRSEDGKVGTLTSNSWQENNHLTYDEGMTWRKLTPLECERLQTVPDNYTNHVSNTQRYKMLGNGWTVDVIAHIFKGIK
jgi:DNA-cytosine methyltransferase